MRQYAKKPKPNPNNNPRRNVRSTSIRAIIGDRRFNQFRRVNTDGIEGTKKVKRMEVGDAEVHDIPNWGQNGSSNRSETGGDPRGCSGDLAAKTSEYAFFKRIKTNTFSDVNGHPNAHDNQLSKVQHGHNFTREEVPNVQNESIKYVKSSSPNEKEQNEAHYSFLSPPCHSAVDGTNVQHVRSGLYNCLSPSVRSKKNNSGNKGVFSAKREKLRHLAADRYDVKELSSEGFDLVSALISRILPAVQDNNTHRDPKQDEIDSEYKLPPFPELESATQIKNHEAYKRKLMESQKISYLDDVFCRPTKKLEVKNLLEWNPTASFSCDDDFCRPTKQNLLEWNPTESFACGPSSNYRIRYNRSQTEGYNREIIKSHHRSCLDILEWNPTSLEFSSQYNHKRAASGFTVQNFDMEGIVSFDEPLPVHESRNFQELDEFRLYTEPKLLEQPQRLLLGWDDDSEKDESFLASSPYITRHLRKQHLLTSSISPYTPKHLMPVEEDCSIKFPFQDCNTWCLNGSLDKEENRGSESFLFLIQSPARKPLSFLDTGLHSLADDENEESFVYGSDQFLNSGVNDYGSSSYMESFSDKRFDRTDYPLLLHDSSRNDEF